MSWNIVCPVFIGVARFTLNRVSKCLGNEKFFMQTTVLAGQKP